MLGTRETALLLDGLKPPPAMELDAAVGTTFTLDLTALLAVPVAATFANDGSGDDSADLLEIVRRYSDRTILFCQAGAISVPPKYRAALTFVEQTVVEVRKPSGGIFHPKVWVVRFAGAGRVHHRVLVMSRNLTFDRAWDVIVRADEEESPDNAFDPSGIVEFLEALPGMATGDLSISQANLVADLARTVASAKLAVPRPFESGAFVPLLSSGGGPPFRQRCESALAFSPFLSSTTAKNFGRTARGWAGIVSRPSALDASADGLRRYDCVRRMKDAVLAAEETIDDTYDAVDEDAAGDSDATRHMRGLHAKIYVQDQQTLANVWIGSANLTVGAFTTNVEMLAHMTGPVTAVGVDALLSPKPEKHNISWFLEDHKLPESDLPALEQEEDLQEIDAHAFELASSSATLTLTESGDHWVPDLSLVPWNPPADVSVRARLLSLQDEWTEITDGAASWPPVTQAHITPFVVLKVQGDGGTRQTLVRAHLVGDPDDRRRSVIANAIASRDDFLRYLGALLGADLGEGSEGGSGAVAGTWGASLDGVPHLLEDLLRTASRKPAQLAYLDETLRQLKAREDVKDIVPEEFHALWDAVYAARKAEIG